ncbi:30S ribosome-binding factor RbfA [candidate division KSB1 bacterium]|nr:30S ribosome-binding factor RbfA [candidate division KSB1 bacterium]
MQTKRSLKIAKQLQQEISAILQTEVKDPPLKMITITRVVASVDLKFAKIYFSVLDENANIDEKIEALDRARAFIRYEIGQRLTLRYVPELKFIYDDTQDYVDNIERIFAQIRTENR